MREWSTKKLVFYALECLFAGLFIAAIFGPPSAFIAGGLFLAAWLGRIAS